MRNRKLDAGLVTIAASTTMWLLVCVFGLVLTVYSAAILRLIWEWFLVPVGFTALPFKGYVGILLVANFLLTSLGAALAMQRDDEGVPAYYWAAFQSGSIAVAHTIGLAFAYILHIVL